MQIQNVRLQEIDAKYLPCVIHEGKLVKVDAEGLYYRELNCLLRQLIRIGGIERIELHNICGQRYIGTDLDTNIQIDIYGTPGNDLGAFMSGPKLVVHGNAQDGCGNTMNEGQIIINGHAGDVTGNSYAGRQNLCSRLRRLPRWHPHERIQKQGSTNCCWANGRRLLRGIHGWWSDAHIGFEPKGRRKMQCTLCRYRHAWWSHL